MKKYKVIIEQLTKEHKTRTSLLDNLYIMGLAHAIQSISLNDTTITRKEYTEIYELTQAIIKELVNI